MDRTPRWILVERSLTGPGNHHYEYALHMARAAGDAGFEVLVAGNLRMKTESWGEVPATIRPTFRHTTYEVDASLGRATSAQKNAWATLVSLFGWRAGHPRQKEAYAREFAREVTDLLAGIEVSGQDHIFFPTLSVAELDGLARVWAAGIASEATWYLQFHFELPEARTTSLRGPTPGGANVIDPAVREWFRHAIRQGMCYRMLFFCPTRSMAERYNSLGVVTFRELPYPVRVVPAPRWPGHLPLRITCAGHARRDKGRAELAQLVELLREPLAGGTIQLYLQGARRKFRSLPRSVLHHPTAIRFVPHPLSGPEYARLIATTDIGLFMYDPHTYRRRCSGVLVEMLAAGVPVVVPAGTWLAEQIVPAGAAVFDETCGSASWRHSTRKEPGRVGAVATHAGSFAAAIVHIVHHYRHYRESAAEFAVGWRKHHSAENVLQLMLDAARNLPSSGKRSAG